MIIRSLPDDGEEHTNSTSPRYSNSSPKRVTIKSAHPVTPKLSSHNHPQTSIPSAESIQDNAMNTPGSHSSSLGDQSRAGGESRQASTCPFTVLLPSAVTFERPRSLGSNPHRDAQKHLRKGSVGFQREREKNRYSFAVGRDTDQGSFVETWQIFVDDEDLQEATQLVEGDQTAYDPDRYELQSIVAALWDKNAALRHEIANIKADELATRREKALRHRHILSLKMPGMLDQYNHESDSDLETNLEKDSENYRPWEKKRDNPYPVRTKHNERFKNRQKSQPDDTASDSPTSGSARRDGQSPIKPQHRERFENRQKSQPSDEASGATSGTTSTGPSSKGVERMLELEKQLEDLTKRHVVSRQENQELKNKTRAIQAERDKFKLENFNLQRTRSNAQYEKLREQYQGLQMQTQELLRQRQELLDMSNNMANKLPGLKEVQTRNLRALQMYWENERYRAHEQSLAQIAEEGSFSSTDTMKGLAETRNIPVQHARPPLDSMSETEKENLSNGQPTAMPSAKTEVATADGIVLRTRQGSTAPAVPGRGLEESRKKGPTPLKQRPGSIIRPAINLRGLPKVATKPPPSYHRVRDSARPYITPSLLGSSSRSTDVSFLMTADYSGESNGIHTADQIDFARIISQIPSDTPASSAWRDVVGQKYEHQDSPLSGLTPFFEMVKYPPIAFNVKGMIKYDIRGSDSMYNLHEFKRGDYVSVYVDGMHDLWPVKLPEGTRNVVYILPRNAIALVCDHGHEHKTFYEVVEKWDGEKAYGANSGFLPVSRGERLHCSHSSRMPASTGQTIETFRCMMSEDGKRRGFVPARVLRQLKAFVAPPLTASLCPCADPQPYTGRARVLVDCGEPSGQLSLKEGVEVEVSHLETDIAAFCVRDPATKRRGFLDATCLRVLRNPVHNAPGYGSDDVALILTPRIFDFRNKELKDMEVLSPEIRKAMGVRDGDFGGFSEGAKWRWEQNLDGTNPYHKRYDEEMAKRRPDGPVMGKMWLNWRLGPPPSDDYYVLKDDLEIIKSSKRGDGTDWNDIMWRTFVNTYPFVPLGPGDGINRARSLSLPVRRNPGYVSEKEQEREGLMKQYPHIGHQPHKKIADGVCPDRDYMSEPITGEPHDLKRRYIYINDDGSMRAYEAETETDVHDLDLWRTERKSDRNWTAWRKQGVLVMPVEEDVDPFSFENSLQKSGKAFGYVEALPEQVEAKNAPDPLNVFRTHQKHGFNLVYQLRKDPRTIPALVMHNLTVNDRFEIIEIPGPETRSVEGHKPTITIRRVKTGSRSETSYGAGPTREESQCADDTLEGPEYVVSPSDLHTMPFLRTALMKGEQIPDYLMPQERETFRFVLTRRFMQGPVWDALHEGRIVSTKLSMMELEDPTLWKSLDSVLGMVKHAYQQKEVMNALDKEKGAERESDSTPPDPQIDDWDFWYPVIQDHTEDGFIDIKGPDLATGQPLECVQIIPGSEESGTYMCNTLHSNQFGLVNANAINLDDPHLLIFPYLRPVGNPLDAYFVLLKDETKMFFISSEHHAKGWIDHQDLPFNEEAFNAVPLFKLFQTGILNIENFEGAEAYMEEVYNSEPVGEQQKPTDTTPQSNSREMTGGPFRENTGPRPLLSDIFGPPASLYCPGSVREAESVMSAAPNTNASTRSQGKSRSNHLSDGVAQSTRKSLPEDIATTQNGTEDETQRLNGSKSTSENNSDLSMIEMCFLEGDRTSKAPEVPIQTKPTQSSKNNTPISTKSEGVSAVVEPNAENVEGDPTVINPQDGNELVISYDDWVKREEAFKDDTSTENRQSNFGWLRESRSVVRDATGQNAEMVPDEVANVEHRSIESTRDSDNTHAHHLSQSGVRVDSPNKQQETNPDRQSKRRRSGSDQSIDDGPDPSRKRTRSTMKSVSKEDSTEELTTGADNVGNKRTSPSRRPSELADGIIRGTSFSLADASGIPTSHSPVVSSYGRPSEVSADVSSTRFPSLHGVGRSSLSQKDRFESDHPYTPDDAEGPPNRGPSVSGSRWTSVLDGDTNPSLSGGRWNGHGCVQVNHPPNSNSIHPSPRGVTPHLGDGLDPRDPRRKITTRTMSSSAPQTSIDSRDSGVKLDSDDDENTDVATPSDITEIGEYANNPNFANYPMKHTRSSPSNAHQQYTELAGSPVSPVRTRFPSTREPSRAHQPSLSTSHLQTTANIPPANSPTQPQQSLAIFPAKTTTALTISPISSPALTDLEPTQWLNEKLTLLIELFLSFTSPPSSPISTTGGPGAEAPQTQTGTGTGTSPRKISRWKLLYFLILGYLLLSMWVARGEWLDANGRGGIWGIRAVRGSHGRWVWGLYTG